MKVFHGTQYYKIHNIFNGQSLDFLGLYVTDTADRAQLYADAGATGEVSTSLRFAPGAAVVELETDEPVNWIRRSETHSSLDKCEATIKTWSIVRVTVYITEYAAKNAAHKVNGKYVNSVEFLKAELGDKLNIIFKYG
jgi:hypothetical protein